MGDLEKVKRSFLYQFPLCIDVRFGCQFFAFCSMPFKKAIIAHKCLNDFSPKMQLEINAQPQ